MRVVSLALTRLLDDHDRGRFLSPEQERAARLHLIEVERKLAKHERRKAVWRARESATKPAAVARDVE